MNTITLPRETVQHALDALKQPQAQEPEVVAVAHLAAHRFEFTPVPEDDYYKGWKELITLQSHREAMAETTASYQDLIDKLDLKINNKDAEIAELRASLEKCITSIKELSAANDRWGLTARRMAAIESANKAIQQGKKVLG